MPVSAPLHDLRMGGPSGSGLGCFFLPPLPPPPLPMMHAIFSSAPKQPVRYQVDREAVFWDRGSKLSPG